MPYVRPEITARPLYIESLTYGGNGLGRDSGMVVFIPFSVPGDRIVWRPEEQHRSFVKGRLLDLISGSKWRIPPRCRHFGSCGGCQWQHIAYEAQCRFKAGIFSSILVRKGLATPGDVHPVMLSEAVWHYRSRVRLRCMVVHGGRLGMGFYKTASHELIDLEECPVMARGMFQCLRRLKEGLSVSGVASILDGVEFHVGGNGGMMAILDLRRSCLDKEIDTVKRLGQAANCAVSIRFKARKGNRILPITGKQDLDMVTGLSSVPVLRYGPGSFSQINHFQNVFLIETVLRAVRQTGARHVLDLYCGMGNLTLPVATLADRVTGVENSPLSIRYARDNASLNGIENARFIRADIERASHGLMETGHYELVILDPPRRGAKRVAGRIAEKGPDSVIYVSCDPMTLARDLAILRDGGFSVLWSQPMDFFPHTYHIESVTLLRR